MGGGCGPNCTTFTLNVPLSTLSEEELESIRKSIIELLQDLGAGKVTVSFREGCTDCDASTENPVNEETLNAIVTDAGAIQTLGDSNFIIAKINGKATEYNNKLIIVKTNNDIEYIDDVGDPEVVQKVDWTTKGITENQIKHVALGKDVKVLGGAEPGETEDTFKDCENIITVTFNEKLEAIRGLVFQNCTSLLSFNITTNLNVISVGPLNRGQDTVTPASVFDGCISLTDIQVDKNNTTFVSDEGVLVKDDGLKNPTLLLYPKGNPRVEYILPTRIIDIASNAFSKTQNLDNVKLPQGFNVLGVGAFKNSSIVSINIPNTLYFATGEGGFSGGQFEDCSRLVSIIFEGGGVESRATGIISKRLFKNCVELKSIDLPARFYFKINDPLENSTSVFEGCTSLNKVTIRNPDIVEYLDDIFKDVPAVQAPTLNFNVANALEEIEFGAENGAFSGLSTADLFDGLRFGADDSGGEGLKKVLLSDPLIKYFQLNVPLSSLNETERNSIKVSVGNLLSTLGGGAVTVDILPYPDSVGLTLVKATTTNEVEAAPLAEKVTKAGEIQTLGDSKFIIAKINGKATEYNNKLIIVKTDNDIAYIDYNVGEAGIVKRSDWEDSGITEDEIKHVAFGKDVTEVSQARGLGFFGSFRDCTSLATITFPVSVILAPNVFRGCTSLISVFLTAGVESSVFLINGAFKGCTSVLAYTADRESPRYSSVEGVLFSKDKTELKAFPLGNPEIEYTVPEGVTAIEKLAFAYCTSLASITLPEGVMTIEWEAFYECTSLAAVTIPKSVTLFGEFGLIFFNCRELETVTFEGERDEDVELTFSMFKGCVKLAAIDLPEKVLFDIVGDETATYIFEGCTSLAKVTVRDSRVTEYLDGAFKNVPAVQLGLLDFNVANELDGELSFGAENGAFSDLSEADGDLTFGLPDSGGPGVRTVAPAL